MDGSSLGSIAILGIFSFLSCSQPAGTAPPSRASSSPAVSAPIVDAGMEQLPKAGDRVTAWLDALDRIRPEDWKALTDLRGLPDGAAVEENSRAWTARILSRVADPYSNPDERRSVHASTPATSDALRHELTTDRWSLVIMETSEFILVRIDSEDIITKPRAAALDRIRELANLLLSNRGSTGVGVDHAAEELIGRWGWTFPESEVRENFRFTTYSGPSASRAIYRTSGGVWGGRLFFVAPKLYWSSKGFALSADPQHWFDGACWGELVKGSEERRRAITGLRP